MQILIFLLYPQESVKIHFAVAILLNTTDLMSVEWRVYGSGEERTSEGTNQLNIAIASRSYFQIYGSSGLLTIEAIDQNQDDYNDLIIQIKRDYLTYANKSTSNGTVSFLLSIPANYTLVILRDNQIVYDKRFYMSGDRRFQILINRPSDDGPSPIISVTEFQMIAIGCVVIGYYLHVLQLKIERYRGKNEEDEDDDSPIIWSKSI